MSTEIYAKNPIGRPTAYNVDMADEICNKIAATKDGLQKICEAVGLPHASTVYTWLYKHENFRDKYALAREAQSEVYVQEMVDSIIECPAEKDMINKTKLYVDTLKWTASKLKPKKYGDSTIIRGDKDNPIDLGLAALLDVALTKRQVLPAIDAEPIHIHIQDAVIIPQKSPADLI